MDDLQRKTRASKSFLLDADARKSERRQREGDRKYMRALRAYHEERGDLPKVVALDKALGDSHRIG